MPVTAEEHNILSKFLFTLMCVFPIYRTRLGLKSLRSKYPSHSWVYVTKHEDYHKMINFCRIILITNQEETIFFIMKCFMKSNEVYVEYQPVNSGLEYFQQYPRSNS